jgi:hypothetical protein
MQRTLRLRGQLSQARQIDEVIGLVLKAISAIVATLHDV